MADVVQMVQFKQLASEALDGARGQVKVWRSPHVSEKNTALCMYHSGYAYLQFVWPLARLVCTTPPPALLASRGQSFALAAS